MNEICDKIREKIEETDLKAFIYADDTIWYDIIWGEDVRNLIQD
jgi:hypothetical protein